MTLRIGTHTVAGSQMGLQHLSRMQADEQSTILREAHAHGTAYFGSGGAHYKVVKTREVCKLLKHWLPQRILNQLDDLIIC